MSLNKHNCYIAQSDAVMQWIALLSLNAMVMGSSLCRRIL